MGSFRFGLGYMVTKILLSIFVSLGTVVPACGDKPYPYAFREERVGNQYEVKAVIVRVFDQHTGRTVWKRTFEYLEAKSWSKDHKSLALAGRPYGILVWRMGERTKAYNLSWNQVLDGFLDVRWSPRARFLSFRNWRSGGWDFKAGDLWLLDTWTGKTEHVQTPDMVGQYSWIGEGRIAYRIWGHYGEFDPDTNKKHFELSPKSFYFKWR